MNRLSSMCGIFALIGAGVIVAFVTTFTTEELEIAVHMGAINVAVAGLSTMSAF